MSSFLEALGTGIILADGDPATCLDVPAGRPAEALVVEAPEAVEAAHNAFLAAGARLIRTLSRSASRSFLESHGLGDHTAELLWQSAQIARAAARPYKAWVAAAVGPVPVSVSDPAAALRLQIGALLDGGCDLVCLEGFTDPEALLLALQIKQELHHCPVICLPGTGFPEEAVALLAREGAEVIALPKFVPGVHEQIRSTGAAAAVFADLTNEPPGDKWPEVAASIDILGGGQGISPRHLASWHAALYPADQDHTA